jgi:Ca2+-transporting ATPase
MILAEVQNEYRAKKALDSLASSLPKTSYVTRNGSVQKIANEDIVVGDILMLYGGQLIPADGRLIESKSLEVSESMLTGESIPSQKDATIILNEDTPLSERTNFVFAGKNTMY